MSNPNLPKKILFIDDDASVAQRLEPSLQKQGVQMIKASEYQTALYQFNQQRFDVVVIELELEGMSGLSMAQKFRASDNKARRDIPIIITAGQGRKNTDDALLHEIGNLEVVDKPLTDIKLLPYLIRAVERGRFLTEYEDTKGIAYGVFNQTKDADQAIQSISNRLQGHEKERQGINYQLLEDANRVDDAMKIVDTLLKSSPDELRLINAKGRLLLKAGKVDVAKDFMEKADRLAPHNLERIESMAKMYLGLQNPDMAVEKMKEMISLNPDKPDLKFELFGELDNAGYTDHAVSLCKETTLPKEVVRYYNNKGVALAKDGEGEKALKDYYVALLYYPKYKDNYRILFNIAIAEARKKTPEGYQAALQAIEKCMALAPEFDKGKNLHQQLLQIMKKAS